MSSAKKSPLTVQGHHPCRRYDNCDGRGRDSKLRGRQQRRALDEGLFRRVLGGIACRDYAACAEAVPEAFGLSRATVSRRFVRASVRHLTTLQERRLDGEQWVVLFLDGKRFADDELVI